MLKLAWPHENISRDERVVTSIRGMERGSITDMKAYDAAYHAAKKECVHALLPDSDSDVILLCEGSPAVGKGIEWVLSTGINAPIDDKLMEWCDPYRLSVNLIQLRKSADYVGSDRIRAFLQAEFDCEVRITKKCVVVTTIR